MSGVSVKREQKRRSSVDDPHARVSVTMNAPLVPLGQTKGSLQIQIIDRQLDVVSAREQTGLESDHGASDVLLDWVRISA
jgi:hypothetical protein